MYPEFFNAIGKFKNYKYYIKLEENAKPFIHPVRKITLTLGGKLEKELPNMVNQGIVPPVDDGESYLVNSLVIREKPGGRLCILFDHKDLNMAMNRECYPVPTAADITPKFCETTQFSKLDTALGYWNIPLVKESQALTTFNTQKHRYKFLRMPFCLRMAKDIFLRKIDQIMRTAEVW